MPSPLKKEDLMSSDLLAKPMCWAARVEPAEFVT